MGTRLWFAPFGRMPKWVEVQRLDPKTVAVCLPGIKGDEIEYKLACDEQDQRALIAADGFLLPGSPKHPNYLIQTVHLGAVAISEGRYRQGQGEWPGLPVFGKVTSRGKDLVITSVSRHFLLLRAGDYLLVTLNHDSFAIQYTIIKVRWKAGGDFCVERLLVAGD